MLFPKNLGSTQECLSIETGLPPRLVSSVNLPWILSITHRAKTPAYYVLFVFLRFGSVLLLNVKKSFRGRTIYYHEADFVNTGQKSFSTLREKDTASDSSTNSSLTWEIMILWIRWIFIYSFLPLKMGTLFATGYEELPGLSKSYLI